MKDAARSAIPTAWVVIGKELGRARLDGYIWTADAEGMAEIEAEAAVRRERAKKERESKKRAAKARRDALRAEMDERIQSARDEWSRLLDHGMSFERQKWIEENREFLSSRTGRIAFPIDPVPSSRVYNAARSAYREIFRSGQWIPRAIDKSAELWDADRTQVSILVRRAVGRRGSGSKKRRK